MNPPRDHFGSAGLTTTAPETNPNVDRVALERLIRAHNEIMCPGYLAAGGHTEENLGEPSKSLAEAVEAGWITAAEKRLYEGEATEEDLIEKGYSPEEALAILAEQRDRACAPST